MQEPDAMKTGCKRKAMAGFTIIEILFALAILAVGILGVASMQGSAVKGDLWAGQITRATNIAQDKIEALLSLPYDSVVSSQPVQFGHYNVSWTVADDTPMTDTKTIHLTVAWTNHGLNKSITFDFLRFNISEYQ